MTPQTLIARLLHMVGAGRITAVDDSGVVQRLQVEERPGADGSKAVIDNVLRVSQFGFTSNPPIRCEVVLLRLWGNRTLTLALGTNHQPSRLKGLAPGDSAQYDERGAHAWFKDGLYEVDAAGGDVIVQNAGTVTVKAATKVRLETPTLECTGEVVANCDSNPVHLTTHTHTAVQSGTSSSGAPNPRT